MKTISQINDFVNRNEVIQLYKKLGQDAHRDDWRNRYFNFVYTFQDGRRDERRHTITGNYIFGAACEELQRFRRVTGYNYERDNRRHYFELDFSGYKLQFKLNLRIDSIGFNGVRLEVETNAKAFSGSHYHFFSVHSSSTFQELDIEQYFCKKILPKYLYPAGLFQNIQILWNCDKRQALEYYRERVKWNPKKETFIDIEKACRKQFLRRLNIELCDDFSTRQLCKLISTMDRQKTRKKLFKHPSVFALSDQYGSQFDEDGHEEEFIDSVYSDYPKNALFI